MAIWISIGILSIICVILFTLAIGTQYNLDLYRKDMNKWRNEAADALSTHLGEIEDDIKENHERINLVDSVLQDHIALTAEKLSGKSDKRAKK